MNASYYGIKSFYNQIPPQPYDQFRFSNLTSVPHLCEMMGRVMFCAAPIIYQSTKMKTDLGD